MSYVQVNNFNLSNTSFMTAFRVIPIPNICYQIALRVFTLVQKVSLCSWYSFSNNFEKGIQEGHWPATIVMLFSSIWTDRLSHYFVLFCSLIE